MVREMIKKIVKKGKMSELDTSQSGDDYRYWMSRPPEERIEAVEILKRQFYGDLPRLSRTVRIVKFKQS